MNLNLGWIGAGAVMGLSTFGSGIGLWIVGQAIVGTWKKCFVAGKRAPMIMLVFAAMPMSQTFYGFIIMNAMLGRLNEGGLDFNRGLLYLAIGVIAGISNCLTAISQGKISASASDAQGETGKGFAQYIAVIGIAESIALFCMVFSLIAL
jgi:V/A-type H+-transporting ATPase subunit K